MYIKFCIYSSPFQGIDITKTLDLATWTFLDRMKCSDEVDRYNRPGLFGTLAVALPNAFEPVTHIQMPTLHSLSTCHSWFLYCALLFLLSISLYSGGKRRWKEVEVFLSVDSSLWPLIHSAAIDSVITPQTWNLKPPTTRAPQDEMYQGKKWTMDRNGKIRNCHDLHSGWEHLFKTEGCFCFVFWLTYLFCASACFNGKISGGKLVTCVHTHTFGHAL